VTPKFRPRLLCFLVAIAGLPHAAVAATRTSVRAVGMGGAFTAVARGVEATRWNPANLAFDDAPNFALELFSTQASIANNGIDLALYNRTAGAHLDESDKRAILSSIPADGLATSLEAGASALGMQYGRLAIGFTGEASAYSRLPHEVFQLVLMGNAVADSVDFSRAEGEAISYAAARLGAATSLGRTAFGPVYLGITLKYLEGLAYGRLEKIEGTLLTRPSGLVGEARASLTTAGRGQGMGFDVGLATDLGSTWRAGMSLENVYGRIHFDSNLERRTYVATTDTLDVVTVEDASSADSLYSTTDLVESADPFSVDLPRLLHLGLARIGEESTLAFDYEQGFATRAGASTTPAVSGGAEWRRVGWLPLRLGLRLGGQTGSSASAGIGLRLASFRLDIAAATVGRIWPGNPRGIVLGVGTGLEF
jgi:hypothetical protein